MRASALVAACSFACVTTVASAQKVPRPGSISGVIRDSVGAPIPNVEIADVEAGKAVRTDSLGRFLLGDLPSGNANISFRRLSYAPVVLLIAIPPADTTDVQVALGVVAQELKGMVTQAHPDQLRQLVGFETRRSHGIGHFITRAQIEDRHPLVLSDMLRSVPGAILINADNGRTSVRFSRVARNNCPPQFFVDGVEVTGFSIDDMPPGDVEGVELYPGAAGLPPEYNRVHGTSICGTVIIWTRIPSTAKRREP
ncbi:MAG TPA: carboxypeptidase regulatory-like domain-containing protein [Gemmatimonadaceae bacterium]|jgi:hypothetical protein